MSVPPRGHATIVEVRPFGFAEAEESWTGVTRLPRYFVTYMHERKQHHLMVTAHGASGLSKQLAEAVRADLHARQFSHDWLEGLLPLLPLEVEL